MSECYCCREEIGPEGINHLSINSAIDQKPLNFDITLTGKEGECVAMCKVCFIGMLVTLVQDMAEMEPDKTQLMN